MRIPTSTISTKRFGSTYLAVMSVSLIVSMIAFGGIQVSRVRLRRAQHEADLRQARMLAVSAVEAASAVISYDTPLLTNWRETTPHDRETGTTTLGSGSIAFRLVDPDGDLNDDSTDRVFVYGYGRVGDALWIEKAEARLDTGRPISGLQYAIHCRNTMTVKSGSSLEVTGSPASTDSHFILNNSSHIVGDAIGRRLTGLGTVEGSFTSSDTPRGFPSRTVVDFYKSRATTVDASGTISGGVLGTMNNDFGASVNPDGLYYIDTGGADITFDNLRLSGTLVVDAGLGTITFKECLLEPSRDDFPTLILIGNVRFSANQSVIIENQAGRSLNPIGSPYLGQEDSDQSDQFPVLVKGLVHIVGSLEIASSFTAFRGTLLVEGPACVSLSCTIESLPGLTRNPPIGYSETTNTTQMIVSRGSWSRQPASAIEQSSATTAASTASDAAAKTDSSAATGDTKPAGQDKDLFKLLNLQ